jgi:hypothetical protein
MSLQANLRETCRYRGSLQRIPALLNLQWRRNMLGVPNIAATSLQLPTASRFQAEDPPKHTDPARYPAQPRPAVHRHRESAEQRSHCAHGRVESRRTTVELHMRRCQRSGICTSSTSGASMPNLAEVDSLMRKLLLQNEPANRKQIDSSLNAAFRDRKHRIVHCQSDAVSIYHNAHFSSL